MTAIIAPSTLTVIPGNLFDQNTRYVPTVNFSSNFGSDDTRESASSSINRLATNVVSGAEILPIPIFFANASYTSEFLGPSLRCQAPSNATIQKIDAAFDAVAGNNSDVANAVYAGFSPYTPAWEIWPFDENDSPVYNPTNWSDFVQACLTGQGGLCPFTTPAISGRPCDATSGRCDIVDTSNALWIRLGSTHLACSIELTNYTVNFDASNPITSLRNYNFAQHGSFFADSQEAVGFISLTQSLLNVFQGSTYYSISLCALEELEEDKCSTTIMYETAITTIESTALGGLVLMEAGKQFHKIWSTVNVHGQFEQPDAGPPFVDPFQVVLSRNLSLAALIEEASRNLTLSLFSDSQYLMSNNSTAAVTTTTHPNIYSYNFKNLVIAYSVAFGAAAAAVVVGSISYFANGQVSCHLSFSSILCATRNGMLDDLVKQHQLRPLAVGQGIYDARLKYGTLQASQGEGTDGTSVTDLHEPDANLISGFGQPGQMIEGAKGYKRLHPIFSSTA